MSWSPSNSAHSMLIKYSRPAIIFIFSLFGIPLSNLINVLQYYEKVKMSLLKKCLINAQKDFPTVGDWHSVILGVLEKFNMNYSEDEIRYSARGNSKKISLRKSSCKLILMQNKQQKIYTLRENYQMT